MAATHPSVVKLPDISVQSSRGDDLPSNGLQDVYISSIPTTAVVMDTDSRYHGNPEKLPKIILRDVVGRELDTDTSYQRAISERRWRLGQGEAPTRPEEWRMPHAPPPARPDYTRAAPPAAVKRLYKQEVSKQRKRMYNSQPDLLEALEGEKDYADLRWSLQQVEGLPALVGANLLTDPDRLPSRTYLPFVGTAPIINRDVTETDRREAEYVFPGFCSGCTRGTGLCYGCERDSRPHFHHDKPFRTGGGFSYYKRDKPVHEIASKNPANWRVSLPAPRGLPPTSYVFYDETKYPDFKKYGVKVRVSRLPPDVREAYVEAKEDENVTYDRETRQASRGRREVTFASDMGGDSGLVFHYPEESYGEDDQMFRVEFGHQPTGLSHDQTLPPLRETSSTSGEQTEAYTVYGSDGEVLYDSDSRPYTEEDQEKSKSTLTDASALSGTSATSSRGKGLYKAPKPFQLKKAERKTTEAKDPFSKDRVYDIKTGEGIQIKKSDKKLTEIDEFNFGEGKWEEPNKFEFKDRPETVPTQPIRREKTVVEPPPKAKTDLEPPKPKKTPPKPKQPAMTLYQSVINKRPNSKHYEVSPPMVLTGRTKEVVGHKETRRSSALLKSTEDLYDNHAEIEVVQKNVEEVPKIHTIPFAPQANTEPDEGQFFEDAHIRENVDVPKIQETSELSTSILLDTLREKTTVPITLFDFGRNAPKQPKPYHTRRLGSKQTRWIRSADHAMDSEELVKEIVTGFRKTIQEAKLKVNSTSEKAFPPQSTTVPQICSTTAEKLDPSTSDLNRFHEATTKDTIDCTELNQPTQRPNPEHLESSSTPSQVSDSVSLGDAGESISSVSDVSCHRDTSANRQQRLWRLVVDQLSRDTPAPKWSLEGVHWRSEPSVDALLEASPEYRSNSSTANYAEKQTDNTETELYVTGHRQAIVKKPMHSNPRRVSMSNIAKLRNTTDSPPVPDEPSHPPQTPLSKADTIFEPPLPPAPQNTNVSLRRKSSSVLKQQPHRKQSEPKEEGVSLHPLVQQIDTPQVDESTRDVLVRLPSVGSTVTSQRTLSAPKERHLVVKTPPSDTQEPILQDLRLPPIPKAEPVTERSTSPETPASPEVPKVPEPPTPKPEVTEPAPQPSEPEPEPEPVPTIPEVEEEEPEEEEEEPEDRSPSPQEPGKPERKKRDIVKKERKQREPPVRKTRREVEKPETVITEEPEPEQEEEEVKEKTLTPEPEPEPEPEAIQVIPVREKRKLPSPPPMRRVAPPPLPRAIPAVPPLPREYTDPDRPVREVSQTLMEAPPPMYEPPKQRRAPPMKRPKAKPREFRMPIVRSTDTPAAKPDVREMVDPLDYLAKYCIIHKDRLPLYERVFNKVVKEQMYRYSDVPHPSVDDTATAEEDQVNEDIGGKPVPPPKTKLEPHEEKIINDFSVINRSTKEQYSKTGANVGDQTMSKVAFTLDTLIDKFEELQEKHDKVQGDRIMKMADIARAKFPELTKPDWKPKKKKGKKKKKKASPVDPLSLSVGVQTEDQDTARPHRITEVDIVARLDKKQMEEINKDEDIIQMNMDITRLQEKLRDVDDRIEDLEDEKKLMGLYSRDEFQRDITKKGQPEHFLRRQSALYRKMHPQNDEEMNVSELAEALQQINGHLISEKELQFIFHILDIPGRRRVNLQLFSVIAALSEKVRQVDPFIRKLINKFDYEALNVKMDRSKELFWLLDEQEEGVPSGKITSTSLAVELTAGGVTAEHTNFVVNKFTRENKGIVDFMDYLTYVPLFIEIHGRIIDDPLSAERVF